LAGSDTGTADRSISPPYEVHRRCPGIRDERWLYASAPLVASCASVAVAAGLPCLAVPASIRDDAAGVLGWPLGLAPGGATDWSATASRAQRWRGRRRPCAGVPTQLAHSAVQAARARHWRRVGHGRVRSRHQSNSGSGCARRRHDDLRPLRADPFRGCPWPGPSLRGAWRQPVWARRGPICPRSSSA
jgi:hypothetical protein